MDQFYKIQLIKNTKKALVEGWSGANETKLNALTVLCDTSKNYGVLCGLPNNIVVIDYDIYKLPADKRKEFNLEKLLGFHGEDCLIVKTGRGGFHVYHQLDETTQEWTNVTGLNGFIDIKTTGGYVVGPNSTFEGNKYELIHVGPSIKPLAAGDYLDDLDEKVKEKQAAATESRDYTGKSDLDLAVIRELLEEVGFTNVRWKNGYEFDCNQKGRGTTCPLCDQTHTSNHFYVFQSDLGAVFVKNFSNKCSSLKIQSAPFLFTDDEKQLIQNEDFEEDYIKMKRDFEKKVCFIEECISYAITNPDGAVNVLSTKQLRERFMNLNYIDSGNGKTKSSFIETWIRDKYRRFYNKIDFIPEGCPPTTFNLWTGYEVQKITADGSGTTEPFMQLLDQLTEGDTDYFIKWLAFLFQHPGSKPITSPVFTSVQGTGKNSFFDLIGKMMGKGLYYETNDPENHLFGRFSGCIERCKFLFLDEFESSSGFKHSSRIKGIITNERHTIEPKGLKAYEVQNLLGVAFASNNAKPVNVEGSDRRFFAYNPQKNLDHAFFKLWRAWVKEPQNQRAVYDYLMDIDLKDVDWENDRPITQIYKELKYNSLPSLIKWLDYTITENYPSSWACTPSISSQDVYENYKKFGHTLEKSTSQFGKAIRNLCDKDGIRGFKKAPRSASGTRYTINRGEVFEWLKEKGYTEANQLETMIEEEKYEY